MSELCINRVLSSFWYIPRWINELKTTTMASIEEGALQPVAWHSPLDSKLTIGSSLAPLSSGACQLELWFAPIITNLAILLFSTFVVWGLCKGWILFSFLFGFGFVFTFGKWFSSFQTERKIFSNYS